MTDPNPEALLPQRGIGARALAFLLTVLFSLVLYAMVVRPLRPTHFLWVPETRSQDLLVKMRPKPARHPDVVEVVLNNQRRQLVNAQGEALEGRSLYASLIRRLHADGARVIVLDTYLPGRTTREEDGALWRAMADTGKVYLPIKYDPAADNVLNTADVLNLRELEYSVLHGNRTTVSPYDLEYYTWYKFEPPVWDFTRNAGGGRAVGIGMATYQPDPDGVVRHVQHAYITDLNYPAGLPPSNLQTQWQVRNVVVPSQAIPPALRMFNVDKQYVSINLGRNIQITGSLNPPVEIPVDEWARAPINFLGAPGVIPAYNAADVLDGKTAKGTFNGKLVVLGVMGPFQKADNLVTPVSKAHPRMDVTAQVISGILARKHLVRTTHLTFVPLMVLAIVAGLLIPAPFRVGRSALYALLILLAYLVIAVFTASAGVLLPVLSAVLVVLLAWVFTMLGKAIFPTG